MPRTGESHGRAPPEFVAGLYRSALAASVLALFVFASTAEANPTGGTVTNGSASIVTSGNTLDINQSTQRAVINWQSFNIAPNQTTVFNQPSSSSVTLNRVNASNPSQILGTLDANGDVILVNPDGVFFGTGSKVDVNGLVATTVNIGNANFMAGNMNFSTPGNPNASIVNQGTITAKDAGLIGLVAPNVINSGTINAKLGNVDLSSGDMFTMDMYGDGLISVGVSGAVKQQVIRNSGTINAAGGTIQITAAAGRSVVNSLVSISGKLNAPTAQQKNGEIIISAAGSNGTSKTGSSTVVLSGALNASGYGAGQTGGSINVTADKLTLASGAVVDASGAAGGGTVNIGGDLHGQGALANAAATTVQSTAQVKANAVTSGNGGRVVIWSDQETTVNGSVQAEGGSKSGNGGFAETSSHGVLNISTAADTSASRGQGGEWLLDPASLTISTAANLDVTGTTPFAPTGAVATSNLNTTTLDAALNAGTNVTIVTGGDSAANAGDITISNAISTTGLGSLTLSSYHDIVVNAGITLAGGALMLRADNAGSAAGGYITIAGAITTNGGNITMGGGTGTITAGNGYAIGSVAVDGDAQQVAGVSINDVIVNAGGGNIIVNGEGLNTAAASNNDGVNVVDHGFSTTGGGAISINGIASGSGNSANDVGILVTGGAVVSSVNGNITLTGAGGGAGTGANNDGVEITTPGSAVEATGSGNVSITGTGGGGGGSGAGNIGVYVSNANGVQATGTGGITLTGIGGNSTGNSDVGLDVTGSVVASGGAISLIGTGEGITTSADDYGIQVAAGGDVSTVTGALTITGTGGGSSGANNYGIDVAGSVASAGGVVSATGTGGGGTGGTQWGILISGAGSAITNTGTGTVTLTGIGGGSGNGSSDYGVDVAGGGVVSTANGNISVTGTGGDVGGTNGSTEYGVYINGAGSTIETTGTGSISATGTGGNGTGTGASNYGVYVTSANGVQTTGGGNITVTGLGGGNTGSSNRGISLSGGSITAALGGGITLSGNGHGTGNSGTDVGVLVGGVVSAVDGNITITGMGGGSGSGANNYGFEVSGVGNAVETTGAGNISVTGTGGDAGGSGGSNIGAYVNALPALKAMGGGAISVTGTGGASSGSGNGGILASNTGFPGLAIGTTAGGAISLNGFGGGSGNSSSDYGVEVNSGVVVSSANGNISVIGTGGSTSGGSDNGVYMGGSVLASGGAISVSGTGGGAGAGTSNYGVYVTGSGSTIETTGMGNVSIIGTGGNASGTGGNNYGVFVANADGIETIGTGTIAVTGTGSASSGGSNYGVNVTGSITGAAGDNISVTGTGGDGSGNNNLGVYVSGTGAAINAAGTGTVAISGIGAGTANSGGDYGVDVAGGGVISAANGNLSVMGLGGGAGTGANNYGIYTTGSGSTIETTGTGNVSVNGTGGNGTGSGASNFGVYVTDANGIQTTGTDSITVRGTGGASSGGNNDGVSLAGGSVTAASGQNILITGTSGSGSGTYGFSADSASSVNATGGGNITIVTDTDYFGAASNLTTGSGRWLVYSANPADNNDTALSNNFVRYSCTYGGSCPSFPATGDGLLYSFTPILTATPSGISITYGSPVPSLTGYVYTLSGYLGSDGSADSVSGALNGSTTYTAASSVGTYSINYANSALTSALGYGFSYANNPGAITVNPAALTVTANSFGKTYGTTYSFAGNEFTTAGLVNGDTVSSVTLASAGAAATATVAGSPYAITGSAAVGAGLSNYTISYVNGNLMVNPVALTITANSFGKTYGTTYGFAGNEFTTAGLVNGDTVSSVTLASAGAAATATVGGGPYAITASAATGTGLNNYTISYVNGNLTVNPAALTITANSFGKTYGTTYSFAGNEFTTAGLVNGDTVSSVTLASAGAAATATVGGGPYAITASAATGTGLNNYTISYVNGNLTVNPAALTITANSFGKTYGTTYSFAGNEFTTAGLVNGDTVSSVTLASAGAAATATVAGGPYAITGSAAVGAGLSNYTISYVNGNLTVNPAALTITANSFGKTYGTTYSFAGDEFTTAGLVNGDTVTNVSLTSPGAAATAAVGGYAITGSAAVGAGLSNYTISYVNGNLTVNPAALTITANSFGKTYGTTYSFAGDEFTTAGLVNGDTVTNVSLTSPGAAATAAVGGYAITGSAAVGAGLSNYTISYVNGNLTVNPAALTITANSFGKTYGTTYTFAGNEFTTAGLVNGDTVTNVSLASPGAAATATVAGGSYAISGSNAVGSGLSNYSISYVNGQMTVNPAALTITANSFGKTYGTTYTFAGTEFTTAGLVNGNTVSSVSLASPGTAATATVTGGPYAISGSAAVGTGLSNYTISYVNGNLTVNPSALTITAENLGKTYGTTYDFTGSEFTASGLLNGDTVSSVSLSSPGAAATATVAGGPYVITASRAVGTGVNNYSITYNNGQMTINPAALTITADNLSKIYGTTYNFIGGEFTTAGLVNGNTVSSVNLSSAGAAATATVLGGPYTITNSGAVGTGLNNYNISYVNGQMTVNPAALTIVAHDLTKTYGSAYTFLGTEFTALGLVNGDTVTGVTLTSPGARAIAPIGPYLITPSGAIGTGLSNYSIGYVDSLMIVGSFTVPGTIIATVLGVDGSNSSGSAADAGSGTSDDIRTPHGTSAPAFLVNPCLVTAAQDTLSNQLTTMLDLVEISSDLAAELPFYKIQTHSFDVAHISCRDSADRNTSP